jgi:hypothetical protein
MRDPKTGQTAVLWLDLYLTGARRARSFEVNAAQGSEARVRTKITMNEASNKVTAREEGVLRTLTDLKNVEKWLSKRVFV